MGGGLMKLDSKTDATTSVRRLSGTSVQIGTAARPTNPNDISSEAGDFLDISFMIDHERRPTANELLAHPFLAKV